MAKGFSLADQLFNMDTVAQLADGFGRAGIFDPAAFHADLMADLQSITRAKGTNRVYRGCAGTVSSV
jgi:hypothetical protein